MYVRATAIGKEISLAAVCEELQSGREGCNGFTRHSYEVDIVLKRALGVNCKIDIVISHLIGYDSKPNTVLLCMPCPMTDGHVIHQSVQYK